MLDGDGVTQEINQNREQNLLDRGPRGFGGELRDCHSVTMEFRVRKSRISPNKVLSSLGSNEVG